MPEISLQAYEKEIDQLIEQARYLEALAHVRHMLGQFPHYVGAYYLLGKTMLEVDLPELAADMFRRALSANPEHLMARIGLGLAHERTNNLDASIWNLLRALELDPGNNDIGDELRRMYGRRDGLEPDYIPQTPAGLARLYIRGDRNGRAVAQLRALLEEEPARPDLMTALAEAYWRNEQIVQASDLCQEILDKMPYNCKANLLLGTLWVNSGQEEGRTYLQRAQEIDPINAMAAELFGSESLLEPQAVTLDRLVYDPDAIEVDQESAWFKRLEAASVTTGISEAPPEMTESEMRLVDITAGLESQIEIPDWLRELGATDGEEDVGGLGWMADLGAAVSPEVSDDLGVMEGEVAGAPDDTLPFQDFAGEPELPEDEAEEVSPDWLQELTTQESSFDFDESEGAPDWLKELVGGGGEAEELSSPTVLGEVAEVEDSSDWLADLAEEEDVGDPGSLMEPVASDVDEKWLVDQGIPAAPDEETPDWLKALQPEAEAEADVFGPEAAEEEGLPDWLSALTPTGAEPEAEVAELEEEGVPDWLSTLTPTGAEPEAEVAELEEEDVPDWLSALTPTEAEPEAEVAEFEEEDVPDWLSALTPTEAEPEAEVAELEEEGVPDWLSSLAPTEAEAEAEVAELEEEGVPDWLSSLAPTEAEPEAEVAEFEEEGVPDWLSALTPTEAEPEVAELEEEGVPDWLSALTTAGVEPEAEVAELEEEGVPDWLSALAPTEAEAEAEVAELEEEGVPDWLAGLTGPDVGDASADAGVVDVGSADWLSHLTQSLDETAEPSGVTVEEEIPDWLRDLGSGEDEPAVESLTVLESPEFAGFDVEEEGVLTGADALNWLDSLMAETKAEAAQSAAAVDDETLEMITAASEETEVTEIPSAGMSTWTDAVPEESADMLSGDDALAWLQSLTVGKEAELRAQATAESEARVAEILGRKSAEELAKVEEPAPEVVEPAAPAVPVTEAEELLSGDDALAWLESLAAGKEDELRAQGAVESEARVAEILGRKPTVRAPEVEPVVAEKPETVSEAVEMEAPVTGFDATIQETVEPDAVLADELLEEGSDLLSGDDALAWLESLAIGKEDELRAQGAAESEARVAEILGRKPAVREPEPEPKQPVDVVLPAGTMDIRGATPMESPPTVVEMSVDEEAEVPTEQGDLMSGDDALAWLQSLTAGKEDELRAQAEAESAARVDEILGRRHEMPKAAVAPIEPEFAEAETATIELPEGVATSEVVEPVADKQDGGFFGWSSFGDEIVEVSPVSVVKEEPAVDTIAAPAAGVPEDVVEEGPEAGEDALAWLSELSPQKASELEALLQSGGEVPADQEREQSYFGWSAFGGRPEEVPEPALAPEVETADESTESPKQVILDLPAAESEVVPTEFVEIQPVEAREPRIEVSKPIVEEPAVAEQPTIQPGVSRSESPVTTVTGASAAAESTPAEEAPRLAVIRPEAKPSAATADDLDEMRDYTKRKRSDHAARLALARALWQASEIQESMQHYGRLIKSGSLSDEVTADLEHYVESGPSSSSVMRTLGDAYMKFGDLEKALAIYNRAMDLL